jgi:peptidoglycan/LPS O-acetylase OafA/YrhL
MLTVYFLAGTLWALHPGVARAWTRRFWPGLLACGLLLASWHFGFHRWLGPWVLPPALFWLAARLPLGGFEERVGGDYSYGLYIYGYPVQQMLSHFGAASLGYPAFLSLSFAAAGLLAAASWHWIERPALSLKNLSLPPARLADS